MCVFLHSSQHFSQFLVDWCYNESGVRELKRSFETICRKYAVELIHKYPGLTEIYNRFIQEQIQEKKKKEEQQQKKLSEELQAKQAQQKAQEAAKPQANQSADKPSGGNKSAPGSDNTEEVILDLDA